MSSAGKIPKFKVAGLLSSPRFQKCRYLLEKLHKCYPESYAKPENRGMLDLDWGLFLTKMKRRHGARYYLLRSPVAVYVDDELIGDDEDFMEVVAESYRIELDLDFEEIAEKEVINYFENIVKTHRRKFAFLTVAIDEHIVGCMLFMLYNDLVPITCDNFLQRCIDDNLHYSYKGTSVHRIAKYSWIQCGGYSTQPTAMPCENYAVPHDRRGVLSMSNNGRHTDNTTQFFIALEKAPWMDYNYVAFGQLIQGAEVLDCIEKVPTEHQRPKPTIRIVNCGEFSLCPAPEEEYTRALNPPYSALFDKDTNLDDINSILSESGFKTGKYCLKTDLRSYMPFTRYSKMFDTFLGHLSYLEPVEDDQEEMVEDERKEQKRPVSLFKDSTPFYHKPNIS